MGRSLHLLGKGPAPLAPVVLRAAPWCRDSAGWHLRSRVTPGYGLLDPALTCWSHVREREHPAPHDPPEHVRACQRQLVP